MDPTSSGLTDDTARTRNRMEQCLGTLIARVCKAHRSASQASLTEVGLHAGQEMLLLRLWERDGMPQTDLADDLGVTAPTLTRMLQRVERCGLVSRRTSSQDTRVSQVYLSERGRGLMADVASQWASLEAKSLEGFTLEERVIFRRLLMQMHSNLTS